MSCGRIRNLFGAYWDDEITQAEREWVESHFTACEACRHEYESFSRTLEVVGALARHEAAPELVDRVTARTRHISPLADRLPAGRPVWVPATAAAALAAVLLVTLSPWSPLARRDNAARSPLAVSPSSEASRANAQPVAVREPERRAAATGAVAVVSDSLFDHSEDVEFILDPVTVKRGRVRPATPRTASVQGERAVITF